MIVEIERSRYRDRTRDAPRVFDLFAQASTAIGRQDAGLGIGLTVVKRLVQDHGGSVRVHSAGIGCGTTFVVGLPRVHELLPDEIADMTSTPRQHAQRILIVDDNRDAAEALEALLAMSGHQCEVAYDGRSALVAAEAFRPSVAVIDIGLPDMTGFEVARGLREMARGKPLFLVALSGYTTPDFRQSADEAGFDHYFAKPMSIDDLYAGWLGCPKRKVRRASALRSESDAGLTPLIDVTRQAHDARRPASATAATAV